MEQVITAETLTPITHNLQLVITTNQLAQLYGAESKNIQTNYARNQNRFIEGKHFFKLAGRELNALRLSLSESQNLQPSLRWGQNLRVFSRYSQMLISPKVRSLILWTERGAARHAKMLETEQAWEVFERLEDCYFNQPGAAAVQNAPPPATHQLTLTDAELNSLAWLWCACSRLLDIDAQLMPLLEAAEHRLAPQVRTMISEYGSIISETKRLLVRETAGIHCDRWQQGNWCKTLPMLRA